MASVHHPGQQKNIQPIANKLNVIGKIISSSPLFSLNNIFIYISIFKKKDTEAMTQLKTRSYSFSDFYNTSHIITDVQTVSFIVVHHSYADAYSSFSSDCRYELSRSR